MRVCPTIFGVRRAVDFPDVLSRAPASRFLLVSLVENPRRWQRNLLIAIAAVVALVVVLRRLAGVILDRWWFDTVTDAEVWRTNLVAQTQLTIGTGLVTAVLLGSSVWFVLRVARYVQPSPNRVIERYHERMGPPTGGC